MKVVMIGADRSVHGGVSAVVNGYYKAGLDEKVDLCYIGTMVDGKKWRKLLQAVWSYLRFLTKLPGMDILHVNMAAFASYYRKKIFIDTASLFRKKIIIHEHGGDFQSFYYEKNDEKGRAAIRRTLNKAGRFLVLSETWADFFAPIVEKEKIVVLENGVLPPEKGKRTYDDHNLLFLGRLCREKGVAELLGAMPAIVSRYPDTKLYLGGIWEDDTLRMQAEALSDVIIYGGWVGEAEKEQYMEQCSIFVLPTYFEGQPISLLEAMAKGMAIVSTAVGGIPQIVADREDGILIGPKDSDALAEQICGLLGDTKQKETYGQRARKKIEEAYDLRERVERLAAIYRDCWERTE